MKRTSNAYKQAMNKKIRDHSYMMVTIGIVSNEAQATARITSPMAYFSDNSKVFSDSEITYTYATLEENVFKVDGSMKFAPESMYAQLLNGVGAVSEDIGNSITVEFDNSYNIKGLTIDFGEYYPTEFTLSVNGGEAITYQNDSETYINNINYNGVNSFTITPLSFVNGDNKRLRINTMLMGVGLVFQNDDIETANFTDSASFISEELPQINFNVTCFDKNKRFNVDDNNSFINYLEIGQEITTSLGIELEDGTIEWVKMPVTFLSTWSSNSDKIAFQAVDKFAFLTQKYSDGNTIHTRTLYDDAIAVLTYAGLDPDDYDVDRYLRTITVSNPMPEVSVAECLQLIANAGRCSLRQDNDGRIVLNANFENIIEPTEMDILSFTHAWWSNPSNIRVGVDNLYADMTKDYLKADGSLLFLPENTNGSLVETGYISNQIADHNGDFFDNLLPYPYSDTNSSRNGLQFKSSPDGSIHIKGTCTANTWYSLHNNNSFSPWMASTSPWAINDVLQCDYFIDGSIQGYVGITWTYKTNTSSASQGYIFNRAEQPFNMDNCRVRFSEVRRQDIDPSTRAGEYITCYIYVKAGCVIDATFYPTVTKRTKLNELLVGRQDRFMRNGSYNTYTNNGITYTLLDDGSILVNGTATAESNCELVNPYNASQRMTLVSGHSYKVSEGREEAVTTYHTAPYVQFVRYVPNEDRYDYTVNTARNSEVEFTADDGLLNYGVRITVASGGVVNNVILKPSLVDLDDYDSTELSPTNYVVGLKPNVTLVLPTAYTYYSLKMNFGGNPPQEMTVTTYQDDEVIDELTVNDITNDYQLFHEFYNFDKIKFDFLKGSPNDRVVLQKVSFSALTDYRLEKKDMYQNPIGSVEPKTRSMSVRVFSFVNENGSPKMVDDSVYYTQNIDTVGESVTFENQLISTQKHAQMIAKWLGNYYMNNIAYSVDYRGDPRIETLDYIFLDSDVLNNLQVEVEALSLEFNGAIKGSLELKRAFNMIGE